jgi:hypothetical protein
MKKLDILKMLYLLFTIKIVIQPIVLSIPPLISPKLFAGLIKASQPK